MKRFLFSIIAAFAVAVAACAPVSAQYFTIAGSAGAPSVSACGTGATITGLDHSGTVSVGSGLITACTVNFSTTLVGTVRCIVYPYGLLTTPLMLANTVSNAGFTVSFVSAVPGAKIDYHCFIN